LQNISQNAFEGIIAYNLLEIEGKSSRHVESVILMQRCGLERKK
jgi:hypothetical protein